MSVPIAIAGVGLMGSMMQARGQQLTAANQERAYHQRSAIAGLRAADARHEAALTGISARARSRRESDRMAAQRATQRAAVAGSGLQMSGSNIGVLARTAQEQEADLLTFRFMGDARKASLMRAAATQEMTALNMLDEGRATVAAGRARASQTLLLGAARGALSLAGGA